jgi:hypothetical protein
MPALDAVRAPRKVPPQPASKRPANQKNKPVPEKKQPPRSSLNEHARQRLLWLLVISTAIVIFLAWLLVFPAPATNNAHRGYFQGVSEKLQNLLNAIKTDIQKLRENPKDNNANVANDQQIEQLENQVFPQFNNPTKQ